MTTAHARVALYAAKEAGMPMGDSGQCLEGRRTKHSLLDAWPPPTLSLSAC
jgi:hypothetical protein